VYIIDKSKLHIIYTADVTSTVLHGFFAAYLHNFKLQRWLLSKTFTTGGRLSRRLRGLMRNNSKREVGVRERSAGISCHLICNEHRHVVFYTHRQTVTG